jgi:YVTN family beta-propeller protein
VRRFRNDGAASLLDRSSRPRRSPTKTTFDRERLVSDATTRLGFSPARLSAETGVPARTISRILARHNIPGLAWLDPITGTLIRATKATQNRYEHERPGDMVHVDVKRLGRIPDGTTAPSGRVVTTSTRTPSTVYRAFDPRPVATPCPELVRASAPLPEPIASAAATGLAQAGSTYRKSPPLVRDRDIVDENLARSLLPPADRASGGSGLGQNDLARRGLTVRLGVWWIDPRVARGSLYSSRLDYGMVYSMQTFTSSGRCRKRSSPRPWVAAATAITLAFGGLLLMPQAATAAPAVVAPAITVGSKPSGMAIDSAAQQLYVANTGSDNVSVIDTATNSVTATVSVGTAPNKLALDVTGNRLFVANNDGTVSVVDTTNYALASTITVGSPADEIQYGETSRRLYVESMTADTVSVIDPSTGQKTNSYTIPDSRSGFALDDATGRLFIGGEVDSKALLVLNAQSGAIIHEIPLAADINFGVVSETLALDAGDNRIWVGQSGGFVQAVDLSNYQALPRVEVGTNRGGTLAVDVVSHQLFALSQGTYSNVAGLSVVDGGSNALRSSSLIAGFSRKGLAVDTTTHRLYYSVSDGTTVQVVGDVPVVNSAVPASGFAGKAYSHTFTADAYTPVTWAVTTGTLPAGLTLNAATGVLSGTPTASETADFTVTATTADGAGTQDVSLQVDVPDLTAPKITAPKQDSSVPSVRPTFAGSADKLPGTDLAVVLTAADGSELGTAPVADDGSWSFTPGVDLLEGAQTVTATATLEGATSTGTDVTFTVDTTAPATPVVTAPADGDTVTTAKPTFTGTSDVGNSITVRLSDGTVVCTTMVQVDGSWTCTPTTGFKNGTVTYTVTAADAAGNETTTDPVSFTVDVAATTPPPGSGNGGTGSGSGAGNGLGMGNGTGDGELAFTGANLAGSAIAALLFLGAGITVLILRRRRRATASAASAD